MDKERTGRIIRSISGFYDVQTADGVVSCRARGILRKENCNPLTGDLESITVARGKGMVEKVLPRRNSFVRPAVANVDALVVFAANVNPVTEPFLIDRVAAIAGDQETSATWTRPPIWFGSTGTRASPSSAPAPKPARVWRSFGR